MTTIPFAIALPLREGHEAALRAALDGLGPDALTPLVGARPEIFIGSGDLVILAAGDPRGIDRARIAGDAAARLREVLETHTAFDASHPEWFVVPAVRHAAAFAGAAPNASGATGGG